MKKALSFGKTVLIIISLLLIWFFVSFNSNPLFLPTPLSVLKVFKTLLSNGMLLNSIWISFLRITIATTIACLISIPLGLIMFSFTTIDKIISPIVQMFRYFPINAFYPLLILWLGIGNQMKIMFLFLVVFVYFLPSIVFVIKDIDHRLIDTGYTMGLNKFNVITKIVLPYTAPAIAKSVLLMYAMGWTYIPIAEMVNSVNGLGYLINIGSARGRTDIVFTSIITIILISFLIDNLGNFSIRKIFKWKFLKQIEE